MMAGAAARERCWAFPCHCGWMAVQWRPASVERKRAPAVSIASVWLAAVTVEAAGSLLGSGAGGGSLAKARDFCLATELALAVSRVTAWLEARLMPSAAESGVELRPSAGSGASWA